MRAPPTAALLSIALAVALAAGSARGEVVRGPKPQTVGDRFVAEPPVHVESWVEGLEAPWSLVFLPDGRALVSERPGRIRLIEGGNLREEPYAEFAEVETRGRGVVEFFTRLLAGGEAGLMGLALHPDFAASPYVYAMYTHGGERGPGNRVVRLEHQGDHARFDRVIVEGIPGALNHNGGRIGFGPDGHLYITTGEIYQADLADDLGSLGGKILRVDADGGIPPDNPFSNSPVYAYGNRNPQGLAWHPETGDLFSSEHGPSGEFGLRAYDEINVIEAGGHYGWPQVVGAPGNPRYRDPIVAWPDLTTPPAGMAFWQDDLFVATLRSETLLRIGLVLADGRWRATQIERWFADGSANGRFGRLRDAVVGPDGALYVLTSNRDGRGRPQEGDDRILRVTPRS